MPGSCAAEKASAAVSADSHRRAAYAQLAMVAEAYQADGEDFEALREALLDKLKSGWGKDGHRTNLVHLENINAAFLHAVVGVLATEEVRRVWPYWRFWNPLDDHTSQFCDALANVVRPAAEAWWFDGRIPPLHMGGCRSLIEGITMKEAHRLGVTSYYPLVQGDVHHGYGYGKPDFEPDLEKFPPELAEVYLAAVKEDEKSAAPAPSQDEEVVDLLLRLFVDELVRS